MATDKATAATGTEREQAIKDEHNAQVAFEKEQAKASKKGEPAKNSKPFPQVGDAVRTHRGAAAGWATGRVAYVTKSAGVVIELEGGREVTAEKGNYEPADGKLPDDRHIEVEGPREMVEPIIGQAGPVMVATDGAPSTPAGTTLPSARTRDAGKASTR